MPYVLRNAMSGGQLLGIYSRYVDAFNARASLGIGYVSIVEMKK